MPINYDNGKIYRVINDVDNKVWINSTCQSIAKQIWTNRADAKKQTKKSPKIFEHMNALGPDHFTAQMIESYPCRNKDELNARREYWISKLKPELNEIVKPVFETEKDDKESKLAVAVETVQRLKNDLIADATKGGELHKEQVPNIFKHGQKTPFKMTKTESDSFEHISDGVWYYCHDRKLLFLRGYKTFDRCYFADCKIQTKDKHSFVSGNDWFTQWAFILNTCEKLTKEEFGFVS